MFDHAQFLDTHFNPLRLCNSANTPFEQNMESGQRKDYGEFGKDAQINEQLQELCRVPGSFTLS